jgi:transposase-like protein
MVTNIHKKRTKRGVLDSNRARGGYMSIQMAALELGVSRPTIYYWERIKKIILYQHDQLKKVVVLKEDVLKLKKQKRALRV